MDWIFNIVLFTVLLMLLDSIFFKKKETFREFLKKEAQNGKSKFYLKGKLKKIEEEPNLKKIVPTLKKIVQDSTVISRNVEIVLNKNNQNSVLELRYLKGGSFFSINEQNSISESLNQLNDLIKKNQGNLSIKNFFNDYGGVVSSSILIEIPLREQV